MADMGMPRFSESPYYGIGFGLGFSVTIDPAKAQILGTPGEYGLGRRRLDRVLVRSGGGHGGGDADPAHAVLDLPDPPRAARARLSGDRRLKSGGRHAQHRTDQGHQAPSAVRRRGRGHRHHAAARPARVRADPRRLRGAFGPAVPRPAHERRDAGPVQRVLRPARDDRQRQSRRRHQVPAPVEPRHHDRRADPAGRHAHDLPEGQLLLALRLLVQAHPLAVLDPDRARLPAGRRQHRVPVHARGVGVAAAGAAVDALSAGRRALARPFARPRAEGHPERQDAEGAAAGQAAAVPRQSGERPARALCRRPCRPHRRLARGDRQGAAATR